jgi:hypothetical protein
MKLYIKKGTDTDAVQLENQVLALELMELATEDFEAFKAAVKQLSEEQTTQIGWWFQRLAYWSNANPQERHAFLDASEPEKEVMVAEGLK